MSITKKELNKSMIDILNKCIDVMQENNIVEDEISSFIVDAMKIRDYKKFQDFIATKFEIL